MLLGICKASGFYRFPSVRRPDAASAMRSVPDRIAGRASGFRFYHFGILRCWNVVAPSCGLPAPQARLSGPCARTARPPGRNESGHFPVSGMRQALRSPSARTAAPAFRHALRSGPHRGAGIRFPFLWLCALGRATGLPPEVRFGILMRNRSRGAGIRDEKPAGPGSKQAKTILCVWLCALGRATGLSPEDLRPGSPILKKVSMRI